MQVKKGVNHLFLLYFMVNIHYIVGQKRQNNEKKFEFYVFFCGFLLFLSSGFEYLSYYSLPGAWFRRSGNGSFNTCGAGNQNN